MSKTKPKAGPKELLVQPRPGALGGIHFVSRLGPREHRRRIPHQALLSRLRFPIPFLLLLLAARAASAFIPGDRVQATDNLNVRSCASLSCTPPIATVPGGSRGLVLTGPVAGDGYSWWRVRWDSGPIGWSVQNFLINAPPAHFTLSQPTTSCDGTTPRVHLSWSTAEGAFSYDVWRDSTYFLSVGLNTAYTDATVSPGEPRVYSIRAWNSELSASTFSNPVVLTTPTCVVPPQITIGPPNLDFGTVDVSHCTTRIFAIQHVLGTGLASGSVSVSLSPPYDVISGGSFSLSNGQGTNVSVQFCPHAASSFSGSATVSSNAVQNVAAVALTGSGHTPPPATGTIEVRATLDGAPWAGSVSYSTAGPEPLSGTAVPANYFNRSAGTYTFQFSSGGPIGANLTGVSPGLSQLLVSGGVATFTMNFETPLPEDPVFAVTELVLKHRSFPSGDFVPISEHTIDGNKVLIEARLLNSGSAGTATIEFRDVESGALLPGGLSQAGLADGESRVVSYLWDTEGRAWTEDGLPHLAAHAIDAVVVGHDSERAIVTVAPRPVVLVHGLWSSSETWSDYGLDGAVGFLEDYHPLWRAYAVGDGLVPGLRLFTGDVPLLSCPDSYVSNASRLRAYVSAVRNATNAETVDVVAHSMGGLITREYIDSMMSFDPGGRSINSLLTLGTPHLGTPCGEVLPLCDFIGLASGPVQDYFGAKSLHSVPVHTIAGFWSLATCGVPKPGDLVVPIDSARFAGTASSSEILTPLIHTAMTSSATVFDGFVRPLLTGSSPDPSVLGETTERSMTGTLKQLPSSDSSLILYLGTVSVAATGQKEVAVSVPFSESLLVGAVVPTALIVTLIDPAGGEHFPQDSETPLRLTIVSSPTEGLWRVQFRNTTPLTRGARLIVRTVESVHGLNLSPVSSGGNTYRFIAEPTEGGNPIRSSTGLVEIKNLSETVVGVVGLHDDGRHQDGRGGDGVYGSDTIAIPEVSMYRAVASIQHGPLNLKKEALFAVTPSLFSDGFESGDLSFWSSVRP